jgi:hypothetical protein
MLKRPEFITSEYAYSDKDGWHLRDDAPEELKKELEEWNRKIEEAKLHGVCA